MTSSRETRRHAAHEAPERDAVAAVALAGAAFTAAMIPVVDTLAQDDAYWRSPSAPASAATPPSSPPPATSPASGMATRAGRHIGFLAFLRYGLTITLATLALATAYILLRYT